MPCNGRANLQNPSSTGLTDAEKFAQYANILSNLTDEAIAQQGIANNLYQQYQDMAAQKGIDIFQPDKEREASKKGIATASQDSVDENNGRLTAIQGHTYSINENVKTVQEDVHSMRSVMAELYGNSAAILAQVQGIRENTDTLPRYLPDMAEGIDRVGAKIDDLIMRGVKIK